MRLLLIFMIIFINYCNCYYFHQRLLLSSPLSSSSLSSSSSSSSMKTLSSPLSSLSYIHINASLANQIIHTERTLRNEFSRFIFLRDFLDVTPMYNDDDYNDKDNENYKFPIKPYISIHDSDDVPLHTPKVSYKLECCNDISWYYY